MNDIQQSPRSESVAPLKEAPGAKASFHLGLWGLIANLLCCLPVGMGLAIAALVKHGKAKRAAAEVPDRYRRPNSTGFVLGIAALVSTLLVLPMIGMVSAIAVPALLGQRERARLTLVHYNAALARGKIMLALGELSDPSGARKAGYPTTIYEGTHQGLVRKAEDAIAIVLKDPEIQSLHNPYETGPAYRKGEPQADDLGVVRIQVMAAKDESSAPTILVVGCTRDTWGKIQTYTETIPVF